MGNKKRISLSINIDNIADVLNKLNIEDKNITFNLDIIESKDTYKTLSTCPEIIDWEIIDNESEEKETLKIDHETKDNNISIKEDQRRICDYFEDKKNIDEKENTRKIDMPDFLSGFIVLDSYNNLATYLEAAWRLSQKSPGLIPGKNLFNEAIADLYNEIGSYETTIEHVMLQKILEAYYFNIVSIDEAVVDCIEKLKTHWKEISTYNTIVEVAVKLFKKNN